MVSSFWCLICRIHAVAAVTYWSLSSVTVIIISLINASFVDAVLPHKWITTAISKTSIFLRPFISLFHFHFYYYFGLSFVKHTTLFTGILSFRYVFFSVLIILIWFWFQLIFLINYICGRWSSSFSCFFIFYLFCILLWNIND